MSDIKYRADVDGLRAVAVLIVLFFHAGYPGFSGGFVGVDVFFVISGFLITSLILKDLGNNSFSISQFYERRFRRILPAMFVAIVVAAIAAWFILLPPDLKSFGKSLKALSGFYSNFFFWKDTEDYFGEAAELMPLLHTWSLAVEEQFYIIFPLLLVVIYKYHRIHLRKFIIGLCLVSFGLRIWGENYPASAFFLLHYRGWELMLGALLATLKQRAPVIQGQDSITLEITSMSGLVAILAAVTLYNVEGVVALLPISNTLAAQFLAAFGAFTIIWANTKGGGNTTFIGKFLSLKTCVWIGLISYSLYLWHWPALVFAKLMTADEKIGIPTATLMLLLSFVGATLTYHFIEQPFRKRTIFAGRRSLFIASFAQLLLIAVIGRTLATNGLPDRFPAEAMQYLNVKREEAGTPVVIDGIPWDRHLRAIGQPTVNTPDFLIWGDSHADMLSPLFDEMARSNGLSGWSAYYHSNPPLLGVYVYKMGRRSNERKEFNDSILRLIKDKKIKNVVLSAFWAKHAPEESYKGFNISDDFAESKLKFQVGFNDTISFLRDNNVNIYVVNDVPSYPYNIPRELAKKALHGGSVQEIGQSLEEHNKKLGFFNDLVKKSAVSVIDTTSAICPEGQCITSINGKSLYTDANHLSPLGIKMIQSAFIPFFDKLNRNNDKNLSLVGRPYNVKLSK